MSHVLKTFGLNKGKQEDSNDKKYGDRKMRSTMRTTWHIGGAVKREDEREETVKGT
jgi:hypothetical protein